ncbi:MAG: hypothetical protein MZV70_06420, partial [Desulfobacterales bacterium]|nr:hypothetical protein [Desulfobacterales bacterium]
LRIAKVNTKTPTTFFSTWWLRRAELMEAVTYCSRHGIEAVVSKREGMHCGHGIRRWESAEALYNAAAFTKEAFPFVLQPFMANISDVRVVVVGDYVEAYLRENLYNFQSQSRRQGGQPGAVDGCGRRRPLPGGDGTRRFPVRAHRPAAGGGRRLLSFRNRPGWRHFRCPDRRGGVGSQEARGAGESGGRSD